MQDTKLNKHFVLKGTNVILFVFNENVIFQLFHVPSISVAVKKIIKTVQWKNVKLLSKNFSKNLYSWSQSSIKM